MQQTSQVACTPQTMQPPEHCGGEDDNGDHSHQRAERGQLVRGNAKRSACTGGGSRGKGARRLKMTRLERKRRRSGIHENS